MDCSPQLYSKERRLAPSETLSPKTASAMQGASVCARRGASDFTTAREHSSLGHGGEGAAFMVDTDTHRSAETRGIAWGRLLQVLTLVLGVWILTLDVDGLLHDTGLEPMAGRLGFLAQTDPGQAGWLILRKVEPDGATAKAGLRTGDRIRLDRPEIFYRASRAGEVTGAVVERAGARRHVDMVALPVRRGDARTGTLRRDFLEAALASILPALFGLFIALRSRGRLVPTLLGLSLLFVGAGGVNEAPQWVTAPIAVWLNAAFNYVIFALTAGASVAFAMLFAPEGERRLSRLQWASLAAFAVGCTTLVAIRVFETVTTSAPPALHFEALLGIVLIGRIILIGANLTPALLKSPPRARGRYTLLLVGFALMLGANVAINVIFILDPGGAGAGAAILALRILSGLVAPALFAYAILKNRVLDLGFAVNRTLVYGVVSALLLSTFGLVEWGVDHFVPIAGREKNVLVDAAVAVVVFLSFHRVRDFVERAIEGLFFRRWQEAEAALRTFVREAAFIERSETLTRGFTEALGRFTEGAEAALYFRKDKEPYLRADGAVSGVGETIDPDDPALIALRAAPKPLELDGRETALQAALITPMVNRNEVIGAVVLGPKPSGLGYRPDEIELIGWATRQVGLDLHALKVEQLESKVATLHQDNETLRSIVSQRS